MLPQRACILVVWRRSSPNPAVKIRTEKGLKARKSWRSARADELNGLEKRKRSSNEMAWDDERRPDLGRCRCPTTLHDNRRSQKTSKIRTRTRTRLADGSFRVTQKTTSLMPVPTSGDPASRCEATAKIRQARGPHPRVRTCRVRGGSTFRNVRVARLSGSPVNESV